MARKKNDKLEQTPPSPRPWYIQEDGDAICVMSGDLVVAEIPTDNGRAEAMADAQLICHAVNSYSPMKAERVPR